MHSPKFALISQIYLKFGYFCQFLAEILIIFPNWHNFFSYHKGEYLQMISGKNVAWEATGRVGEVNICPKIPENCQYSYIKCNHSSII